MKELELCKDELRKVKLLYELQESMITEGIELLEKCLFYVPESNKLQDEITGHIKLWNAISR